MAIPDNIREEHILMAIEEIDNDGIPAERRPTKHNLIYKGKQYPPKYVISLANKYANGYELAPDNFSGGKESNIFLSMFGLTVMPIEIDNSYTSYSWSIVSSVVAIKEMDRSSFLYNSTGIPNDVRFFFDVDDMEKGERRNTTIIYNDVQYQASFIMDKLNNPRTKLQWSSDLTNAIKKDFPNYYEKYKNENVPSITLKMKFTNYSDNELGVVIDKKIMEPNSNPGEFDHGIFNRSITNKEYVGRKDETKYYILTVKETGNLTEPPYQTLVYRVILLENHKVIKKAYVHNRDTRKLLTPAKEEGINLLLEHDPDVQLDDVTMVHYKQDRPNAKSWEKDKQDFSKLFLQVKQKRQLDKVYSHNIEDNTNINMNLDDVLLFLDLIKANNRSPSLTELKMMVFHLKNYDEVKVFIQKMDELEIHSSFKFRNGTLIHFIEDYNDCVEFIKRIYETANPRRKYKSLFRHLIMLSHSKEQALQIIGEAKRKEIILSEEEWSNKFNSLERIKNNQEKWRHEFIESDEYRQFPQMYREYGEMKANYFNNLSLQELKNNILKQQERTKGNQRKTNTTVYHRSLFVKEYAKRVANGICQLCDKEAPFKAKEGEPFLEVHHIQYLSKGGSDTLDNVIALCPNCHRKIHNLELKEDLNKIILKATANFLSV